MAGGKKPNFQPYGNKKSGGPKKPQQRSILGDPLTSKKQSGSGGNSRKVHDTKGKNTHGRRSW